MADGDAQSKTQETDDGFETIHLPFQSDIYDKLEISDTIINVSDIVKNNYYKLCNVYKDNNNKLYSLQHENREPISNAIILKEEVNNIKDIDMKFKDKSLHDCVKLFSDIPCSINNEEGVKEWINKQKGEGIKKDDMLKCMNINNQTGGIQYGGEVAHQLLTTEQLKLCTKDTISSDDWWKDENKYVEVKVEDTFINVDKEGKITSEENDTYQDVYMTWTDYIKLTFDNIDGLNTTVGETDFTNKLPVGIRVSLKNDEDNKYSEYKHKLRIISYDNTKTPSTVTLEVDDETNSDDKKEKIILEKKKFMELFHSAGGGGVVRDDNTTANAVADSKDNIEVNQETKQEEKYIRVYDPENGKKYFYKDINGNYKEGVLTIKLERESIQEYVDHYYIQEEGQENPTILTREKSTDPYNLYLKKDEYERRNREREIINEKTKGRKDKKPEEFIVKVKNKEKFEKDGVKFDTKYNLLLYNDNIFDKITVQFYDDDEKFFQYNYDHHEKDVIFNEDFEIIKEQSKESNEKETQQQIYTLITFNPKQL